MSDLIISQHNRALQTIEPNPTVYENKKDQMTVQACLTDLQNTMADQGVKSHEYNQKMRYLQTKNLCKSYKDQSRFYIDSTFWTVLGRAAQVALLSYWSFTQHSGEVLKEIAKKLPGSETAFKAVQEIYNSFHERINPAMKSDQLMAQKTLEHLTQSDNTETNIIDRVQQMFQNAKDLLSQLYKSFSS